MQYFSSITKPVHLKPEDFVEIPQSLPHVDAKLFELYKTDLMRFGAKIAQLARGRHTETVFYPLGGFDVTPLVLFPQSKNLIILDSGGPFLRPDWTSPIAYHTESEIVELSHKGPMYLHTLLPLVGSDKPENYPPEYFRPLLSHFARGIGHINPSKASLAKLGMMPLFLGRLRTYFPQMQVHEAIAFPTNWLAPSVAGEYYAYPQSHGAIVFDTGPESPRQTIIYINARIDTEDVLQNVPLSPRLGLTENLILRVNDRHYLPIETLETIDAMVVRGAMRVLQLNRGSGNGFPFVQLLQKRNGILVEGNYYPQDEDDASNRPWEMIPDSVFPFFQPHCDGILIDPTFHYSYGKGIRALFFK